MSLTQEGIAGIRLLVCMARADGVLKADERYALEDALAGLEASLPDGLSIQKLLDETSDPAALAAAIASREARDYTYASVFSLAYCDRELAAEEERLLALLRAAWGIERSEEEALKQALAGSMKFDAPVQASHAPLPAGAQREQELSRVLARYAILSAVTAAVPAAMVSDLLVAPIQSKMICEIAALLGRQPAPGDVKALISLAAGAGARMGVSALAKLIPGHDSVAGPSAFVTTYALGKVAQAWFESQPPTLDALKPRFREEREKAKQEYKKHKPALDEAQKAHGAKLMQFAFDLQQGKISEKEYEARIDALA